MSHIIWQILHILMYITDNALRILNWFVGADKSRKLTGNGGYNQNMNTSSIITGMWLNNYKI